MTLIENRDATQPQVEPNRGEATEKPKAKQSRVLQPKAAEKPATLVALGDDDTATRKTEFVQPKVVDDTFTFRLVEKGPRYTKTVRFDFTQCTDEEILTLALKSARIDLQSKLRAMKDQALNPDVLKTCNVKLDLLESTRDPVDPMVAAARRLMAALGCTIEEANAIVERERAKRTK